MSETIERAKGGTFSVNYLIDGGGSAITTGVKGFIRPGINGVIDRWTILGDQSGSIVIDVWVKGFTTSLPTNSDSITASAPPTVDTAITATSTTLTGWTPTLSADDMIGFNVDSITTMERVTIILEGRRV